MTIFRRILSLFRKAAVGSSLSHLSSPAESRGGWWPIVREAWAGAWQRNIECTTQDVLTYSAVWSCATLIASDISKLWVKLVERDKNGIWTETESPAFSPVLRKPNRYSTRIKFFEYWILSKLIRGNTYALKERDNRGVVVALYLLDPSRVRVLVAPDGSVFYHLQPDMLSGIDESGVTVPARDIIHDLMVPLYHPLVGVSPIHACGLAAMQGLKIQNNSARFFANGSQPGGVLTAPATITNETAQRLKEHWEANFSGENVGRVAVLGDGLTYVPMSVNAHDAQLIDQLKWTAEDVCRAFHMPPWKVGVGPMPPYGNIQAANIEYYSQALQGLIENLELCLDEGLGTGKNLGVEVDLKALLRMDSATQMEISTKGVIGGILKPNEARAIIDLEPVEGGNTPYLQQQNYSLSALNRRDQAAPAPATNMTIGETELLRELTERVGLPSRDPKELDLATLEQSSTVGFRKAMRLAA
jgi:HK97 family phage portal protein